MCPRRKRRRKQARVGRLRPGGWAQLRGQGGLGADPDPVEDAMHRSAVVVARGSPNLTREGQRRILAAGGQLLGQRPQRGRLPRLPRGMHHEIAHLGDQIGRLRQPPQRGDHVVVRGQARPRRVEPPPHGLPTLHQLPQWSSPGHSTVRRVPCRECRELSRRGPNRCACRTRRHPSQPTPSYRPVASHRGWSSTRVHTVARESPDASDVPAAVMVAPVTDDV